MKLNHLLHVTQTTMLAVFNLSKHKQTPQEKTIYLTTKLKILWMTWGLLAQSRVKE